MSPGEETWPEARLVGRQGWRSQERAAWSLILGRSNQQDCDPDPSLSLKASPMERAVCYNQKSSGLE